ncbi:MAG: glycosyltransferase family 39 protein [Bacteroidales bacterium]|nr:glycosyltransferase family 39 protein [Bacteroidales bacterium]
MKNRIIEMWQKNPLKLILFLAIFTRLIATIFSKGFGMHDDHFLVIEAAQSWIDVPDDNVWLPGGRADAVPSGHSFFYVGLHYLIFLFLEFLRIFDPQAKMFIIRLLHGAFSLITVYLGYKIAFKISNQKTAGIVGLLLAVLWFMPFLSVRNLVEIVCIPFLMYGTWLLIKKEDEKTSYSMVFFAGIILGLAFSVRFQTIIFAFGLGLTLLIRMRWIKALVFGLGFFISIAIVQGGIDLLLWGRPFAELEEYVRYNIENATTYITNSWYNYILLILGALIPPLSILIFIGFFWSWRKHLILFLPSFIFLLFHTFFPNKQERFIFPIIPFIIILGIVGWGNIVGKLRFTSFTQNLLKSFWIFFWVINLILLLVFSTMYSKKSRVESMTYLSKYDNIKSLVLEDTYSNGVKILPMFYMGEWINYFEVTKSRPLTKLPEKVLSDQEFQPRFILFFNENDVDKRVVQIKEVFPNIVYETTIEPGLVDKILYWLNPRNSNLTITIYRNEDFFQ